MHVDPERVEPQRDGERGRRSRTTPSSRSTPKRRHRTAGRRRPRTSALVESAAAADPHPDDVVPAPARPAAARRAGRPRGRARSPARPRPVRSGGSGRWGSSTGCQVDLVTRCGWGAPCAHGRTGSTAVSGGVSPRAWPCLDSGVLPHEQSAATDDPRSLHGRAGHRRTVCESRCTPADQGPLRARPGGCRCARRLPFSSATVRPPRVAPRRRAMSPSRDPSPHDEGEVLSVGRRSSSRSRRDGGAPRSSGGRHCCAAANGAPLDYRRQPTTWTFASESCDAEGCTGTASAAGRSSPTPGTGASSWSTASSPTGPPSSPALDETGDPVPISEAAATHTYRYSIGSFAGSANRLTSRIVIEIAPSSAACAGPRRTTPSTYVEEPGAHGCRRPTDRSAGGGSARSGSAERSTPFSAMHGSRSPWTCMTITSLDDELTRFFPSRRATATA